MTTLRIVLAGHSIDRDLLDELRRGSLPPDQEPTPETLSAAYARISRSPDEIPELRRQSRGDVAASRRSNRTIVFRMGHHSIAEHVALNLDVLGVSRLALEALEDARLCSYTEKSQRYVTFDGEHRVPEEFGPTERATLASTVEIQLGTYRRAFESLLVPLRARHAELLSTRTGAETVEGWAKEDARYALGLATVTQVGMTANARNLEYVIRKLRHHPLSEARELSQGISAAASAVVPSLIILSDPERYREAFGREVEDGWLRRGRGAAERLAAAVLGEARTAAAADAPEPLAACGDYRLVVHTPEPDVAVAAACLHAASQRPLAGCTAAARALGEAGRRRFFLELLEDLSPFDPAPREFEHAVFTVEGEISAAGFGQLKRHRMMSLQAQPYDPTLGLTVPAALEEHGLASDLRRAADASAEAWAAVRATTPRAADYLLTNAHRRRVVFTLNLREVYHLARLRMDRHAQWDIRNTADAVVTLVRSVAPAAAALACGKDAYPDTRTTARTAAGLPG